MPILISFQDCSKPSLLLEREGRFWILVREVCGIVNLPFEFQVFLIPEIKFPQVYKTTYFVIVVVLRFLHLSSLFSRLRNPSLLTTRIFFIYLHHTCLQHLPLILTSCSVPGGTPLFLHLVIFLYPLRFLLLPHPSNSLR